MTTFVYLVLPEVSPGLGILLLCGVFVFQICVDIFYTPNWFCGHRQGCCDRTPDRNGYDEVDQGTPNNKKKSARWAIVRYLVCVVQALFENKVAKVIALLLQIIGIFGFIGMWVVNTKDLQYNMVRPMVGYPLTIFVLSVIWSNFYQEKIADCHKHRLKREDITARYKSGKL